MRRLGLAAATLLFAGLGTAWAEDALDQCGGSNVEMTQCILDAYKAADDELNEVWPQVLATIEPSDALPAKAAAEWKGHLLAAQRAWAAFKQEDCEGATAYEWFGGSGADAAVESCLYTVTRARIDDLKSRYLEK